MYEIRNAKIVSTQLNGRYFWLNCEGPGWGQGFGGWRLPPEDLDKLLRVFDVEDWDDLAGLYCRVGGDAGSLDCVGHIVEDRWFKRP